MVELRSLFDELRYAELFAMYLNKEEAYVVEKNYYGNGFKKEEGREKAASS